MFWFLFSVVHSAILLRQHNEVDTITDGWRCFSCRAYNYSFLQNERGVLIVKYVNYESELRNTILNDYRKIEKSLKLPSLNQDLHENGLMQETPEENIVVESSVMSNDNQRNEESETLQLC